MKKLFVASIMLLATVTFVTAQQYQRQSVEDRAKAQAERIGNMLLLNDGQKSAIQNIELSLGREINTLRQKHQGDRQGMRAAMLEMDKRREANYKEVLTAEQFQKYMDDKERRIRSRQQRNS